MGKIDAISHSGSVDQNHQHQSVIIDVKEGAFSVISDELKIKMKVLGITNEDISGILQSEDDIGLYLEIIDLFFEEVKSMYEKILEKTREAYQKSELGDEMIKEAKSNLLTRLTWHKQLKALFVKFPGIGGKIGQMGRGFNNLMVITRYLQKKEGFQFSPDIYFHFAKINPGRSNNCYITLTLLLAITAGMLDFR